MPSATSAGAMITAAMMNEGGTGPASPRISTATALKIAVSASDSPAASTISADSSSPSPVSDTTATMIPAAAVVAAIGSTARAPLTSAAATLGGVIQSRRSRNDSRNASTVAYSTARNGDIPIASSTTIAISDEK